MTMDEDTDYSEDEEDFQIMRKALDVELPDDFDPNIVPQNGEEYLQLVMYEAKRCKRWVTADVDRSQFKQPTVTVQLIDNCVKAPPSMLPSKSWQDKKIEDFTKFRAFLESKIPTEPVSEAVHDSHWEKRISTEMPNFSTVSKLTQGSKIKLLQVILDQLDTLEEGDTFSYEIGVWLYGILATLGMPLCPHSCYCLRELARKCSKIRSKLPECTPEDKYLPLNLYICIVAKYFNQLDLSD